MLPVITGFVPASLLLSITGIVATIWNTRGIQFKNGRKEKRKKSSLNLLNKF